MLKGPHSGRHGLLGLTLLAGAILCVTFGAGAKAASGPNAGAKAAPDSGPAAQPQPLHPGKITPGVEMPLVVPGPEPDIILLFTGRVVGYVEPCGCPHRPSGGLPRRAGYFELLHKTYPHAHLVLIDAGDFAAEFNAPGRFKTGTYLDVLEDLKYDVVGVGERELAGGLDAFQEMFDKYKLPLTSATYTRRGSTQTFEPPYIVKTYDLPGGKHFTIGFISLHSHDSSMVATGKGQTAVVSRDPVEQAQRFVPELAAKTDYVVLLAGMGLGDLQRVAQAVPGMIDLALGAYGDRMSPGGIEEFGGIKTYYAGDEGKRVGEIRLYLHDGKVSDIKAFLVQLTKRYPADKKYQKIVDKMLVRVNDMMKSLPDSVVKAMASPEGTPPKPTTGGGYRTFSSCEKCHEDAFKVWQGSHHASAMTTLRKANQDFNPDCVKCHSTGYGTSGGFVSMNANPELADVQCEACHGSGKLHLQDPSKPYGSVPPRVCYTCHTKENSPDFSFFKYWGMIKH